MLSFNVVPTIRIFAGVFWLRHPSLEHPKHPCVAHSASVLIAPPVRSGAVACHPLGAMTLTE
jgi:hypothetical protein